MFKNYASAFRSVLILCNSLMVYYQWDCNSFIFMATQLANDISARPHSPALMIYLPSSINESQRNNSFTFLLMSMHVTHIQSTLTVCIADQINPLLHTVRLIQQDDLFHARVLHHTNHCTCYPCLCSCHCLFSMMSNKRQKGWGGWKPT